MRGRAGRQNTTGATGLRLWIQGGDSGERDSGLKDGDRGGGDEISISTCKEFLIFCVWVVLGDILGDFLGFWRGSF